YRNALHSGPPASNPWLDRCRLFAAGIAGVDRPGRLDQHYLTFLVRRGHVLDTARHDVDFARTHAHLALAPANREHALVNQEELICIDMAMPDELALELDRFDVQLIEPPHEPG